MRHRTGAVLLVSLVLLITGAGLFAVLVPVVRAPSCSGYRDVPLVTFTRSAEVPIRMERRFVECLECAEGPRMTLAARWLGKIWWEGREVGAIVTVGFRKKNSTSALERVGIRPGRRISRRIVEEAIATLEGTGEYSLVEINVDHDPLNSKTVKVSVGVTEN